MSADSFEGVVEQIKAAVWEASTSSGVNSNDLHDILAFLTKVVQVVDQSFQDIYTLAIELTYLSSSEVDPERIRRLQKELDLLMATSHYRESLEICSRLKHLRIRFDEYIRPAIENLPGHTDWQQLFWLIEDREGYIIRLVEQSAASLRRELMSLQHGDVRRVNVAARELADRLRPLLGELRELTNEVLGLSGRRGFLELTRDRSELDRAVNVVVNRGGIHVARDTYNVGRAGAVGPNASATNTTFIENRGNLLGEIDFAALASELTRLKAAMQAEARDTPHFAALVEVSAAEDAAKNSDAPTVVSKLKAAGSWAFDTATKIGVSVAAKAIQTAIGLP